MSVAKQYVTLGLDREVFAVPVDRVQEILDMQEIARLPHAPAYMLGMIDLRGQGIPVIDLRAKLGLAPVPATPLTRILVLQVEVEGRELALGLVADRVYEVSDLDGKPLEPAPEIGVRWRSDYITGIARRDSGFVIVFDLAKLFAVEEMPLLEASRTLLLA